MPGLGAEDFSETVIGLLADGKKNFLLNLSLLELIDSSGIGTLIRSFTSIRRAGGHLKLLKPTWFVQRAFKITGLTTVFDIYEDENVALKSF